MRMSHSRLFAFLTCQALYEFKYVDRLPFGPPSPAMAAGRAFDTITNAVYLDTATIGKPLSTPDTIDAFSDAFDIETQNVEDWSDDSPGELKDASIGPVRLWRTRVVPKIVPMRVSPRLEARLVTTDEREIELDAKLDLPPEVRVVGIIDLLTPDTVIDHKMTGKSWSAAKVLGDAQLVTYSLLSGMEHTAFHVGVRTKTPKVQTFKRAITDADRRHVAHLYRRARRAMVVAERSGSFVPNRSSFLCSRRNCSHWAACELRHGGRVQD